MVVLVAVFDGWFKRALEAVTYYLAEFLYDIKLIEAAEKEKSKKTEKCTLSAQQIYSTYTASFSFDDHDYGEECIKLEVASARPILETNGWRTEQTDGGAHKAAS